MNNTTRTIATIGAAVVVAGSFTAAAVAGVGEPARVDHESGVSLRGGPIRLGPAYYQHINAGHASLGVNGLSLRKGCDLIVALDTAPGERVVSVIVEEDEMVTKLGIRGGGSGGLAKVTVFLYDSHGKRVCANDRRFGPTANLWLQVTSVVAPKEAPAA
jgi:hypothetical protein